MKNKMGLIEMLYEQMDKLRTSLSDEEIERESKRAQQMSNIADKIIKFGVMQIQAFDALGNQATKDNIKRISQNA